MKVIILYIESPTNQQFIILENSQMEKLQGMARFSFWEKYDDTHTVAHIATSWATEEEEIKALMRVLTEYVTF